MVSLRTWSLLLNGWKHVIHNIPQKNSVVVIFYDKMFVQKIISQTPRIQEKKHKSYTNQSLEGNISVVQDFQNRDWRGRKISQILAWRCNKPKILRGIIHPLPFTWILCVFWKRPTQIMHYVFILFLGNHTTLYNCYCPIPAIWVKVVLFEAGCFCRG